MAKRKKKVAGKGRRTAKKKRGRKAAAKPKSSVKVIDDRGNELLVVKNFQEAR